MLLDAHALLWWLGGDDRLSGQATSAIQAADPPLVGAGVLIEIAVKRAMGQARDRRGRAR